MRRKTVKIIKRDCFDVESLSTANTELIGLRVPKELLTALQTMAKSRSTSVQSVARSLLWYHFTPSVLRSSVERLRKRELRELSSVQAIRDLLSDFRFFTEHIEKVAGAMERVRSLASTTAEEVEEIAAQWTSELDTFLQEIDAAEEQLETALSLEEETEEEVA